MLVEMLKYSVVRKLAYALLKRPTGSCRILRLTSSSTEVNRTKPFINLGTIGHLGHGKTTLMAAIIKTQANLQLAKSTDCVDLQKDRTSTVHLSHVEYQTATRHYGHTDCPGQVKYIKNMITGAAQIDVGILVVSATEGVMPQTREHLLLAKHFGVSGLVVFINKVDEVDSETVDLIEMEVRDLLSEMGKDVGQVPIVRGSALLALEGDSPLANEAILELLKRIDKDISVPPRELEKPFLMPIEQAFSIAGEGTVVTGRLECGTIKKGLPCEIVGYGEAYKSSIAQVNMFQRVQSAGFAGDRAHVLVRGVKREMIKRGMVLCKPGSIATLDHLEGQVQLLPAASSFISTVQLSMFSRTWDCTVHAKRIDEQQVAPGEQVKVILRLIRPMPLGVGDSFVLRDSNTTVATGVVAKALPPLQAVERTELLGGRKARKTN